MIPPGKCPDGDEKILGWTRNMVCCEADCFGWYGKRGGTGGFAGHHQENKYSPVRRQQWDLN